MYRKTVMGFLFFLIILDLTGFQNLLGLRSKFGFYRI